MTRHLFTALVSAALVVSSGGCTSMQVLYEPLSESSAPDPTAIAQRVYGELKRGDRVDIVDTSGTRHRFVVSQISRDRISGTGLSGTAVSIPYGDIRTISNRQPDAGKTFVASVAATPVVLLGAIALTFMATGFPAIGMPSP